MDDDEVTTVSEWYRLTKAKDTAFGCGIAVGFCAGAFLMFVFLGFIRWWSDG